MIFLELKKKKVFIVFDIKYSFALNEVAITGCGDECVWIIIYLFIKNVIFITFSQQILYGRLLLIVTGG